MPDTFSGAGVERDKAVRKKVIANPVGTIKIESGGAGGNEENPARGIERHPGPIVGGTAGFPGVFGPGVVAEFAGQWNGVEGPAQFASTNVEGANVARRRWKGFRIAPADNNQILEDYARAGEGDRVFAGRLAAKIFAKVNATAGAEIGNRFCSGSA